MARTKNTGRRTTITPPSHAQTLASPPPPSENISLPTPPSSPQNIIHISTDFSLTHLTEQPSVELGSPEKIIAETIVEMSKLNTPIDVSQSIQTTPCSSKPKPPVNLVYSKSKSKSTNTPNVRRSARIQSGIGTKKSVVDSTIYVLNNSDSETDTESPIRPTKPLSQIIEPSKSSLTTKSAPTKSKSPSKSFIKHLQNYLSHQNKETPSSNAEEEEPKAERREEMIKGKTPIVEEPVVKMLPKKMVIPPPLVPYANKEDFDECWTNRPVPSCRYYDFEDLKKGGIYVLSLTEKQGWTQLFKMRETVYPKLAQAFYFSVEVDYEKVLIKSIVRNVEFIITPEILGKKLGLPLDGAKLYGDNWFTEAKESSTTVGEKRKRTAFEPETLEQSENVLNLPPSGNLPTQSISVPFVDFETSLHFDPSFGIGTKPTLPKRSKMEREISRIKRESAKILEAMMQQNNLIMHLMLEFQTYQKWLVDFVAPHMKIPPPPVNPPPHIPEFPQPENDPSQVSPL
ncbi:hypothetical protein TSUD_375320 [Trifolium subterraneum]|uniref:Uncharacterized protein n=1 Tax=Trifolium subterraneum TaxID=3900 RepID=A0A2Z6NL73_TRISU|nr:hypothetical protein TSUD_375320 [Trifolium subterraneum]